MIFKWVLFNDFHSMLLQDLGLIEWSMIWFLGMSQSRGSDSHSKYYFLVGLHKSKKNVPLKTFNFKKLNCALLIRGANPIKLFTTEIIFWNLAQNIKIMKKWSRGGVKNAVDHVRRVEVKGVGKGLVIIDSRFSRSRQLGVEYQPSGWGSHQGIIFQLTHPHLTYRHQDYMILLLYKIWQETSK